MQLVGAADCRARARRSRRSACCAPASRSSSSRAGRPIGAIRAIPACRRCSTFRSIRQRQERDRAVSGAARGSPTARRPLDRLQGRRDLAAARRAAGRRQAGHAAAASSTTRSAKSSACRRRPTLELALTGGDERAGRRGRAAEARVPKAAAVGDGGPLAIRAVRREAGRASPACWSMSRRPRAIAGRSVRRRPDRRVGAAAAGAGRRRARGLAALRLRARRPAARRQARRRAPPADRGGRRQGDRGRISSRLIRRERANFGAAYRNP